MAKAEMIIHTKYCLVIFPVATYKRVGKCSILSILGVPVYKRAGDAKSLFGFGWIVEGGLPDVSTSTPMPECKEPRVADAS